MVYNNAVLTITDTTTPDPYVIFAQEKFFMTFTAGDRVEIWRSKSLINFGATASKHTLWRPPEGTEYSADIWAPELHALRGRWYIYFAAAHPAHGNPSHRMWVLGGPPMYQDPCNGPWEFLGRIHGMPDDHWAVDGTVVELDDELYFIYSGWPIPNPSESDLIQQLFVIKLSSPTEAASQPVLICAPDEPWEKSGAHGINEGPQFLCAPDGSWKGIVYSCAGSWTKDYKMTTLQFLGGDPLHADSWKKGQRPLLETREGPPWGPGHGSFVEFGGEILGIFHGTDGPGDGWNNRKARMQRVSFSAGGPEMGDGKCGPLSDVNVFLGRNASGSPQGHHRSHGLRGLMHYAVEKLRK
ncbi:glycoside hydrolase family 43 protein [Glonium stellatum]|uniref:Glycoside hydrolase family 43 protein n=1 Tax=Glonium stellatum TaxID=574774 RepID=A0A8E2EXR0_9PEZI|nr:glycoside hydrolase family 43 protein [Glonium stellatum]